MKQILLALWLCISVPVLCSAQRYAADVESVDAIIAALYDVISGEADVPRDWDRFRNLFAADARLMPTSKNAEGVISYRAMSPGDYVRLFSSRIKTGFFEQELHRKTDAYGTIVQVFSTYATQQTKGGANTNRGINSIQLLKAHDRYYILNITWCAESMGFPLPDAYL